MEDQLEVMGARRWAGHSLAAPDSLGQKVEQAHHLNSRRRARKRVCRSKTDSFYKVGVAK